MNFGNQEPGSPYPSQSGTREVDMTFDESSGERWDQEYSDICELYFIKQYSRRIDLLKTQAGKGFHEAQIFILSEPTGYIKLTAFRFRAVSNTSRCLR